MLSRDPDNVARHNQNSRQRGDTSPAGMQYATLSSNDPRQTSSAPHALPHRPGKVSFQHTVRGQPSGRIMVQSEDSPAAASLLLLPQPIEPIHLPSQKEQVLASAPVHGLKEIWSKGQTVSSHSEVKTLCTPDGNEPKTPAWQALVALSDSHNRSAGTTSKCFWYVMCCVVHWRTILYDAAARALLGMPPKV